ncbi:hypothetical protein GCK32_002543 [Trichostrongylus colubriformis]|uniref:Uncharacterized protein n=1 Tax=Trichostrongylus colubriformis TaxID=6319 RepID=A0AAN8FD16_TRICO
MLRLTALLQLISCSSDILYTFRGQDALRRFNQYGLSNIYGIKSTLSRKDIVSFPLTHTIGKPTRNRQLSFINITGRTFSVKENNSTNQLGIESYPDPIPILKTAKTFPTARVLSPHTVARGIHRIEKSGVADQLVEIRKVKRIGGGYPYGPRNFSVVEFPQSLKVDKYLGNSVTFMTRNYAEKDQLVTTHSSQVWAIKRFDSTLTMKNESLSCRYCVTYWKMQIKFKPSNVYVFCCI